MKWTTRIESKIKSFNGFGCPTEIEPRRSLRIRCGIDMDGHHSTLLISNSTTDHSLQTKSPCLSMENNLANGSFKI
jgi:hypothetical protein